MLITVNFLRRKCYVELILHTSLPLHFSVMSSAFAITHLWCLPKIRRAFWSLLEQLNGLQVFHALPPYKLGVQDVSSAVILSLFYGGWVTVITSLFSFFFNFVYENEYKLEMELGSSTINCESVFWFALMGVGGVFVSFFFQLPPD